MLATTAAAAFKQNVQCNQLTLHNQLSFELFSTLGLRSNRSVLCFLLMLVRQIETARDNIDHRTQLVNEEVLQTLTVTDAALHCKGCLCSDARREILTEWRLMNHTVFPEKAGI